MHIRKLTRIAATALTAAFAASTALAEDAYIQSDGTQFINTGYFVSPSSKVELDFAFVDFADTSAYVQTRVFDNHPTAAFPNLACTLYVAGTAGQGNHTQAFALGDRETGESLTGIWASSECDNYGNAAKGQFCDNVRRTAVIDEANHYAALLDVNGAYVWRKAKPTTSTIGSRTYTYTHTALRPLVLLGRPTNASGSTTDYRTTARIYGFRIYEGGTLIRNYIPAVKGDEAGLYDKIGGGFLRNGNAAGKPLASGGDILEIPDNGYVSTYGNNSSAGIGELYFDTRYSVTKNTRAELDYALAMDYPTSGYDGNHNWYLFAGSGSSGTTRFNAYFNKTASASFGICGGGIHWKNPSPNIPVPTNQVNIRHVAFVDNYKGVAGMLTDGLTNSTYTITAQTNLNFSANTLKIAKSSKSGEYGYAPLKIYGFNIYEEDSLVRSYKPYVANGISGLLDTVGDGGFISCAIVTNAQKVACGGLIDSDAASNAAFIQTDGTQYIDLGYYAKSATRFELDCALVRPDDSSDQYLFGTHGGYKAGNFPFSMYVKAKSAGLGWNCQTNSSNYSTLTSTRITAERQKFVLDGYNNEVSVLAADGTTLYTTTITHNHANAESPYEFTICTSRGKGGTITAPTPLKVFSVRIYEANVLLHEFVPYMQNGVAGLYDTVSGAFKGNAAASGNALFLSGMGVDGAEMWVKPIAASAASIAKDKTATITAAAAGAIRYKWTLNGEVIEGETGETITATWRRGDYNAPDVYTCTAIYDVFGVETEGEPVVCNVTRVPDAFTIVIR